MRSIVLLCAFGFSLIAPINTIANTANLPGTYEISPTDIMVLDSSNALRSISYDLGILRGNQVAFMVRYANLDALNAAFGDTVTTGGFGIFRNADLLARIEGIISGSFAEAVAPIDSLFEDDSVTVALELNPDSDPLALYRPWLLITDNINPAAINDLAVAYSYYRDLVLAWTAPGDDSLSGLAALYEMRYAAQPPQADTVAWWDSALIAVSLPYPAAPGDSENVVVSGLDTLTTYYFLMVTYDELGNRSGFSNLAPGTTAGAERNFCLYYAGDNRAIVPFDSVLNTGEQLTLEAWFYLEGDYTWNHACIIDKPAPQHEMPFYQYNMGPANYTDFYAHLAVNGWYLPFEESDVIQTDDWTHAAVTFDGTFKRLYLDGVIIDSIYYPGQPDQFATDIKIGSLGNLESWFFKGYIDEIRLWNVARTGEEIALNMRHPLRGDETGLAAYWNFNEGAGQAFFDRTSNHANGFLGDSSDPDQRDPAWVPSTVPFDTSGTGLGEMAESQLPANYLVLQNYPNPFNSETVISFTLPRDSHVRLEVYDMLGRCLGIPIDDEVQAGEHSLVWSGLSKAGDELSSGIYFYRLKTDGVDLTRKMLMIK